MLKSTPTKGILEIDIENYKKIYENSNDTRDE